MDIRHLRSPRRTDSDLLLSFGFESRSELRKIPTKVCRWGQSQRRSRLIPISKSTPSPDSLQWQRTIPRKLWRDYGRIALSKGHLEFHFLIVDAGGERSGSEPVYRPQPFQLLLSGVKRLKRVQTFVFGGSADLAEGRSERAKPARADIRVELTGNLPITGFGIAPAE